MTKYVLTCALLLVGLIAVGSVGATADAPAVGAAAPEFSLTTNEGKQASLKDFRSLPKQKQFQSGNWMMNIRWIWRLVPVLNY